MLRHSKKSTKPSKHHLNPVTLKSIPRKPSDLRKQSRNAMESAQLASFSTTIAPPEQPPTTTPLSTPSERSDKPCEPKVSYSTRTRVPTKDSIFAFRRLDPSIPSIKKTFKPDRPLRIAFFGASDITLPVFDKLIEASDPSNPINATRDYPLIDRVDVVTSPPVTRIIKRTHFEQLSDLAQHVRTKYNNEISVEWYSSDKNTPFRTHFELKRKDYDLAVVFSFPKLIPPRLIDQFPMGIINIHPSLIPLYRGPSPMQAALERLDETTGVSILTIEPHKFDVGRVLAQYEFPLTLTTTLPELQSKVESVAQDAIIDVIDHWHFYYNTSISQQFIMESLEKRYEEGYLRARAAAPKYGSIIGPIWSEMTGNAISGQFRSLIGFRAIHAKIAPKPHVDKSGNIKGKDPVHIVITDMKTDVDGDQSPFQPLETPGSAVYDPKTDAIRVRCAENTTVLVKEIKPASGQPAEAKSITNGFFVKEEGVFRGNFLPPDFQ